MKSFIKISLISAVFQIGYTKQVQTGHTAPVKSSYIVTLKPSTEGNALDEHLDKVRKLFGSNKHTSEKNKINHVYGEVLFGYSADFTSDVLAEVKAMPEVDVVEKIKLSRAVRFKKIHPGDWPVSHRTTAFFTSASFGPTNTTPVLGKGLMYTWLILGLKSIISNSRDVQSGEQTSLTM
ncbi:proteinase B [Entomophthora muscae]|uniref:Proteinase B n=1 Tax=Entomophthora muscae TaxID=34485 RepID=A0ACC2SPN7_9FUNG|nr:proteinase B [Entomophthora muscae]